MKKYLTLPLLISLALFTVDAHAQLFATLFNIHNKTAFPLDCSQIIAIKHGKFASDATLIEPGQSVINEKKGEKHIWSHTPSYFALSPYRPDGAGSFRCIVADDTGREAVRIDYRQNSPVTSFSHASLKKLDLTPGAGFNATKSFTQPSLRSQVVVADITVTSSASASE